MTCGRWHTAKLLGRTGTYDAWGRELMRCVCVKCGAELRARPAPPSSSELAASSVEVASTLRSPL